MNADLLCEGPFEEPDLLSVLSASSVSSGCFIRAGKFMLKKRKTQQLERENRAVKNFSREMRWFGLL